MKKILALLLSLIMCVAFTINIYAGDFNVDEQSIISQLSGDEFTVKVEQRYINQLKNYFCRDNVNIEKIDAEDFILYLKEALVRKQQLDQQSVTFNEQSLVYQNFQKAGECIGLYLEYDSSVCDFYAIDESGYIVIDSQDIIKKTGDVDESNNWNFSIELIFAGAIVICILGFIANLKRWNRKIKRRSAKHYVEDDEDDDELEVANRKTRRARLQTFSYKSVKQVLRYFYIPIIMGLIVIGVGFMIINTQSSLIESIKESFIKTQPIYLQDEEGFLPTKVEAENQPKTISLSNISYPRYSEQYGHLECKDLKIDAPVYWGDRSHLLSEGAGSYSGSLIPGIGGTILVGAHDTTYFSGLENVKKGNVFTFTTEYGIYTYKVTGTNIVDEGDCDKAYDLSSTKEQLVLYTCYPFGKLNGTKKQRMFVYLDKSSGPDIIWQEVQ